MLNLPNVAIVAVDTVKTFRRSLKAIDASTKNIKFGYEALATNQDFTHRTIQKIDTKDYPITTMIEYSTFFCYNIYDCFKPYLPSNITHILFVQYDGYVLNSKAWSDEFMQYDYIGAQWPWYEPGYRVGNGGFSLRSVDFLKKVNRICAPKDNSILVNKWLSVEGEDNICCLYLRPLLQQLGLKFAPEELADKFSIENQFYNDQFGWHGQQLVPPNAKIFKH